MRQRGIVALHVSERASQRRGYSRRGMQVCRYCTPLGFGRNIGVGFGNIGVGFGSIGVGFSFRAGGGNIAVGLGLVGCPAAGDTGEAEGVGEL